MDLIDSYIKKLGYKITSNSTDYVSFLVDRLIFRYNKSNGHIKVNSYISHKLINDLPDVVINIKDPEFAEKLDIHIKSATLHYDQSVRDLIRDALNSIGKNVKVLDALISPMDDVFCSRTGAPNNLIIITTKDISKISTQDYNISFYTPTTFSRLLNEYDPAAILAFEKHGTPLPIISGVNISFNIDPLKKIESFSNVVKRTFSPIEALFKTNIREARKHLIKCIWLSDTIKACIEKEKSSRIGLPNYKSIFYRGINNLVGVTEFKSKYSLTLTNNIHIIDSWVEEQKKLKTSVGEVNT